MTSLEYPDEWRFDGIGVALPPSLVRELYDLVVKVADGQKVVVEAFKRHLGNPYESSSFDWALSDLQNAMDEASSNAAVAIEGIWKGVVAAKSFGAKVPSERHLNSLLVKHQVPLAIMPPRLVRIGGDILLENSADSSVSRIAAIPLLTLHEKLGEGGYGVVHRATRTTELGEFSYAVKLLDPSSFADDRETAKARFRREVAALGTLQHRAIISYSEAGIAADGRPYFVMPLVHGSDLRSACAAGGVQKTLRYFEEITDALAYSHREGVLHRDLKPTNILVRASDNQPIILDFGAAVLLEQMTSESLTTHAVGTLGYIPSEVLANPRLRSPGQDVYACGVMLYECLLGRRPDPNAYIAVTSTHPELSSTDEVIRRAIAGTTSRYSTITQMHSELMKARIADLEIGSVWAH